MRPKTACESRKTSGSRTRFAGQGGSGDWEGESARERTESIEALPQIPQLYGAKVVPSHLRHVRCTAIRERNRTIAVVPGGISLAGVPIDLRLIETPTFLLSAKEDHIAPWRATYAAISGLRRSSHICSLGFGAHRRRDKSARVEIRTLAKF